MMTRLKLAQVTAALLIGSFGLGGCSAIGDTLGSSKYPPDEFLVVAKTPLIIPPDYNLHPPGISNPVPREVDTSELAMRALFPDIATGSSVCRDRVQQRNSTTAAATIINNTYSGIFYMSGGV